MVTTPAEYDTTRRKAPEPPKGFAKPKWVMARSLVFPGWGQAYNGAWFKAAAVAGVEWTLLARLYNDKRDLNDLQHAIDDAVANGDAQAQADLVAEYNSRSDKYVSRQWWLGALLAYSLLDAYIDAHFRQFRVEFKGDPALPPEDKKAAGVKISIQERF